MQKEAWTYTLTAAIAGAVGLLIRWLQCLNAFEPETDLPVRGSAISVIMVLTLAVIAGVLWWMSGRMHMEYTRPEPEDALAAPNRLSQAALVAAALIAFGGAALMFFTADGMFFRLAALLGLISAAVLAMTPSLPRWGSFGAVLAVAPVLFFGVWLVGYYKENSTNPVVWDYAMKILSMAACLTAVFRLCGYVYYRMKPRQTLFACGLAAALGMAALMDRGAAPARLILTGWGLGMLAMCWVLLWDLEPPEEPEEE